MLTNTIIQIAQTRLFNSLKQNVNHNNGLKMNKIVQTGKGLNGRKWNL